MLTPRSALVILSSLAALGARAETRVLFDRQSHPTLFPLYFENPSETAQRPGIRVSPQGIEGRPGDGNFTAYKMLDLASDRWTLTLRLRMPNARYSNSGVYLLYSDPRADRSSLSPQAKASFDEALAKAADRRRRFGAGPFELDFFSHELQIIGGTDATIPPENRGTAAFYGVDLGDRPGQQRKFLDYAFNLGDTYELIIENRGLTTRTYARAVNFQAQPVLVSEFVNVDRATDPVRGGSPIALLLQGFYNNGRDVQLPIFERVEITID